MDEVSDKILVGLLVVAIAISLIGVTTIVNKLSSLGQGMMSITGAVTTTPAGKANVTIPALVYISLPTNSIDFGNLEVNIENATTTDNPSPFTLQNDGTKNVNVTIEATDLFTGTSAGNPSAFYKFKSVVSEAGSVVNSSVDLIDNYTNMPAVASASRVVSNLKFPNANDLVKVHINITVPSDEPAGAKSSTVTLTASQA